MYLVPLRTSTVREGLTLLEVIVNIVLCMYLISPNQLNTANSSSSPIDFVGNNDLLYKTQLWFLFIGLNLVH